MAARRAITLRTPSSMDSASVDGTRISPANAAL
jgi:hypothetical protein